MSQSKALYRLQQIDLKLDKRRKRARAVKDMLEGNNIVSEARTVVTDLEAQLRPAETTASDQSLEMRSLSDQRDQLSQRLYSGTVSNPKELEDLQGKIAELERRHATLEENSLHTLEEVETLQTDLVTAQDQLRAVEASWKSQAAELLAEFKTLQGEIRQLKEEREMALEQVTPSHQQLYKELRKVKGGRAVAVLDGEACSACRIDQTVTDMQRIRRADELVYCSSCGRILVVI